MRTQEEAIKLMLDGGYACFKQIKYPENSFYGSGGTRLELTPKGVESGCDIYRCPDRDTWPGEEIPIKCLDGPGATRLWQAW